MSPSSRNGNITKNRYTKSFRRAAWSDRVTLAKLDNEGSRRKPNSSAWDRTSYQNNSISTKHGKQLQAAPPMTPPTALIGLDEQRSRQPTDSYQLKSIAQDTTEKSTFPTIRPAESWDDLANEPDPSFRPRPVECSKTWYPSVSSGAVHNSQMCSVGRVTAIPHQGLLAESVNNRADPTRISPSDMSERDWELCREMMRILLDSRMDSDFKKAQLSAIGTSISDSVKIASRTAVMAFQHQGGFFETSLKNRLYKQGVCPAVTTGMLQDAGLDECGEHRGVKYTSAHKR